MSHIYRAFIENGMTQATVEELRSLVQLWGGSEDPALKVWLKGNKFFFKDTDGPLVSTSSIDAALTIISAGPSARELLGLSFMNGTVHTLEEWEEPQGETHVAPKAPPAGAQAAAARLRDAMNERREASAGQPVDHTQEGGTIRQVGVGDGAPKL